MREDKVSTMIAHAQDVQVRLLADIDVPALEEMYAHIAPTRDSMGLPPRDPDRRHTWLLGLKAGTNYVAFADGQIVGHLALMPLGHSAEMAVFVHQAYRHHGVATALTQRAAEDARAQGLRYIWVLISSDNNSARQGLLKFGFHTAWESLGEVQMVYRL